MCQNTVAHNSLLLLYYEKGVHNQKRRFELQVEILEAEEKIDEQKFAGFLNEQNNENGYSYRTSVCLPGGKGTGGRRSSNGSLMEQHSLTEHPLLADRHIFVFDRTEQMNLYMVSRNYPI